MYNYKTNPESHLRQKYSDLLTRVEGKNKKTQRTNGLPVGFTRQQFIQFGLSSPQFMMIFENWVKNGNPRRLAPSIERINSDLGYVPGNVIFVTQADNSRLGGINCHRVRNKLAKLTRPEYETLIPSTT